MNKALCIIFFFLVSGQAFAYHKIAGIQLDYVQTASQKYDIFIHVIRQCDGSALGTNDLIARCSSVTLTISPAQQTLVSVNKINPCQPDTCNGSANYEEWIWRAELDLSTESCCDWTLSYQNHFREAGGSAGQVYFVLVALNKCLGNGGGRFVELPQTLLIRNKDQMLNYGVEPGPGTDSVSYALVTGLVGLNSSMTYSGNYYPQRPLTFYGFPNNNMVWPAGFRIDQNGFVLFRPTLLNNMGTIVVRADLWKRINGTMEIVGSLIRDIEVTIVEGQPNNDPDMFFLKEMPDTNDIYYCAGDSSGFIWHSLDQDGDSTYFDVSYADSGISWTLFYDKNAQARLRVRMPGTLADTSSGKVFQMQFWVRDKSCPIPGSTLYTVRLHPAKKPVASYTLNQQCLQVSLSQQVTDSAHKDYRAFWILYDSVFKLVASQSSSLFQQTLTPGKFHLHASQGYPGGCSIDSLFVLDLLPNFRFSILGRDTICEGDTAHWTLDNAAGTGSFSYSWSNKSFPANTDFNASGNGIDLFPVKPATFEVAVSDSGSCSYTYTKSLLVLPIPALPLADSSFSCLGDSIDLGPGQLQSGTTYLWTDGSTDIPRKVKQSGWYWLKAFMHAECMLEDSIYAGSYVVPEIGFSQTDTTLCPWGDLYLPVSHGLPPYSYSWNGQVGNSRYPIKASESLKFVVSDLRQCSDSVQFNLWVSERPSLVFSPATIALCPEDSVELTISQIPKQAILEWSDALGGSTKIIYPGTYTLRLTDTVGCLFLYQVTSSVLKSPNAAFSYANVAGGIEFTPTVINLNHSWSFGDGNSSQDEKPIHTYATPGNYLVKHFVSDTVNNCKASDSLSIVVLSLSQLKQRGIDVFPNPFEHAFSLHFAHETGSIQVQLLDLQGRELTFQSTRRGNELEVFGLENLASGTYILRIHDRQGTVDTLLQKK